MGEIKTKLNDGDVKEFINTVSDESKRKDSFKLLEIYSRLTGEQAKMWGSSIIGFGKYHYKSEKSRQEGDWMLAGFSPRKQNLTLYMIPGFDNYEDLLSRLGKYKTSKSCLYILRLSDIDQDVLEELITTSFNDMKRSVA